MDNIREIKLNKNAFSVIFDNSTLELEYRTLEGKYLIDISNMNLINATKLAILFSTRYFIQGFKKKVCWIVKDRSIKNAISILCLSNLECTIKQDKELKLAV